MVDTASPEARALRRAVLSESLARSRTRPRVVMTREELLAAKNSPDISWVLPELGSGTAQEEAWLEAVRNEATGLQRSLEDSMKLAYMDFALWFINLELGLLSHDNHVHCLDGHQSSTFWVRHLIQLFYFVERDIMHTEEVVKLVVDEHRRRNPNCRLTYEAAWPTW